MDLTKETEATRKLYGLDNPDMADFGRNSLLALRDHNPWAFISLSYTRHGLAERPARFA